MSTLSPCESTESLLSLSWGLLRRHSPYFFLPPWNTRKKPICVEMAEGNAALHGILFWERKEKVLGPISWGNPGANKVREASLLQDFSEPLIVNRDFGLLRRDPGVQHFPQGVLQDMWDILWATQV